MANELKNSFVTHIANQLVESFSLKSDDAMFFYIARAQEWTGGTASDQLPPTYEDTSESFHDAWRRMLGAKRISDTNIYLMADKNPWTQGTIYQEYRDDLDMSKTTFYVTNTQNNVYKCISNNNGAASTSSPFGSPLEVFQTTDGYKWKFMFRIPESQVDFITDTEIPIRNLEVEPNVPDKFEDDRFLQYAAQFNAVNGSIENIRVVNAGNQYDRSVPVRLIGPEGDRTIISDSTSNTVTLNPVESPVDDIYNTYEIGIVSGTGIGQRRTISDYDGGNRIATVSVNWDTLPDNTSYYEIGPALAIDGDGTSAAAKLVVDAVGGVESVEMLNKGQGYTRATAICSTTIVGGGCTLDAQISPYGGHASDPVGEIFPTKAMILVKLQRDEDGQIPVKNDFRQYGILKNPIINTGYSGAGKVASKELDVFNDLKIRAATGSVFSTSSFEIGGKIFGVNTSTCGEIVKWNRSTDIAKGVLKLKGVGGEFDPSEPLASVNLVGSNWSSAGTDSAFVEFMDPPVIATSLDSYRLTTKLVVGPTAGDVAHQFVESDWSEDMGITGACGGTARLVYWTNASATGATVELYLTHVMGVSNGSEYGFTAGENITGLPTNTSINTVEQPKFLSGSGEIIHAANIKPVERHFEQEEELKIVIDLV
tara:strand:- start:6189 stop:8144 length:1956 start_codon:yes stop_codon:yes gene_type:complete